MYIIVGLGNPGLQYKQTRHNVGFKTVDMLGEQLNINITKKKCKALIGEGALKGKKIVLAKPQTYMNLSGESIQELINWYKVPLSNLIVIYDDIDLPVGKIRIKPNGGAGTHNGMRSVVDCLGAEDFARIRIGIGKPEIEDYELYNYVLSKFKQQEKQDIKNSFKNAVEAVSVIIKNGIDTAMNKFN